MRNRKKLTAVLLTAVMALSLAACGGGKEETTAPETKAAQESKAEEPAQTKAEEPAKTEAEEPSGAAAGGDVNGDGYARMEDYSYLTGYIAGRWKWNKNPYDLADPDVVYGTQDLKSIYSPYAMVHWADLDGDGQGEAWEFYNHGDTGWSFYDRDSEGRYWRYFLTAGPEAPLGTADSEKGFVPADPEGNPLLGEDGNPLGPYVLEDGALRLRMGE